MTNTPEVLSLTWLARFFNVAPQHYNLFYVLVLLTLVVYLLLKGLALWRSARNSQPVWFWLILIFNTFGILDIYYLLTHKDIDLTKLNK